MRSGVQLTVAVCVTLLLTSGIEANFDCGTREPRNQPVGKKPVDNKFQIKISGHPTTYTPGEKYTVSLQGVRQHHHILHKFTGFFLTVHPADPNDEGKDVGTFEPSLGDALTQISETCHNAVTQTSSIFKPEIQVYWNAPPQGTGCVLFKATVVEDRLNWYMDDGSLNLKLCENEQENINEPTETLETCCACDEAKYEVTFEGLWSRHTHPKDFPPNGWITKFSDIIGASHSSDYKFWKPGDLASEGLRQVAEHGQTRMLESELKSQSEHIRTIIKARGISFPNVTGKTFAVFRVDRKHHLMSLVSMIDPSPDWIVGVSALELCLKNCSWIESKVLNLFPWDAGTDNGQTYTSPDLPADPQEKIHAINSKYPAEEWNPFYDPSGAEMKPFARLHLTRQRLYEKSCADDTISTTDEEEIPSECAVTEWSEWNACSVTCGPGVRHKQRYYVNEGLAAAKGCDVELTLKEICHGKYRSCRDSFYKYGLGSENKQRWEDDPSCESALTQWSDWSSCSEICSKTRSRKYKTKIAGKKCRNLQGAPELEQTVECLEEECDGEGPGEEPKEDCPWTKWTPCSVTCGAGTKSRTRLKPNLKQDDDPCEGLLMEETVDCEEMPECEDLLKEAQEICQLPKDEGPCRGYVERWYFDVNSETCQPFIHTGCRGNRNNFPTKDACEHVCFRLKDSPLSTKSLRYPPGIQSGSQIQGINMSYGLQPTAFSPTTIENIDGEVVDCKTSRWSKWTPCSVTCGVGEKIRSRKITKHPQNGGKQCPKKIHKRKKCKVQKCDSVTSSKENNDPEPDDPKPSQEEEEGDCILSPWSEWTPCSATCGTDAVMQRTRSIIEAPDDLWDSCGDRLETKSCDYLPCNY